MIKFTKLKSKNIKGFAMAELLAVSIVVLTIFTILFSNYLPLVAEYENRSVYNNVTAEYAAHHFRKMYAGIIDNASVKNFIDGGISNSGYVTLYSADDTNINETILGHFTDENKKTQIKQLLYEYKIEEIIVTEYKLKDLKEKYEESDGKLYRYINYLPTYENYNDNGKENYRIILKSSEFGYATTAIKYEDTSNEQQANPPILSDNMIAVYYDETNSVWRKADKDSDDWYNYSEFEKETEHGDLPAGSWANSVTVKATSSYRNLTLVDGSKKSCSSSVCQRSDYISAEPGTIIPMDDILTMQVWIPRYKYTVWNYNEEGKGNQENVGFSIKIDFENSTASTGEISCNSNIQGENGDGSSEKCKIKATGATCTNQTCNKKTYTHPAFTFGDEELTGFWIGKFELSSDINCTFTDKPYQSDAGSDCNINTIRPLVKPNLTSWRGAMVGIFENNIMAMNDTDNKYGFVSSDDTHMIKNMEWGAVAYLSRSKYGINKKIYHNSNSDYKTGCGPISEESSPNDYDSTCNAYNTTLGQSASTTGNIYGVYDMSGGSWEYVMGNMIDVSNTYIMSGNLLKDSNGIIAYSGYDGIIYDINANKEEPYNTLLEEGLYDFPDSKVDGKYKEKYVDLYSYGTSVTAINKSKLGDATREVMQATDKVWDDGKLRMINVNEKEIIARPWVRRGGGKAFGTQTSSGLFHTDSDTGGPHYYTSRLIIAVTNSQ